MSRSLYKQINRCSGYLELILFAEQYGLNEEMLRERLVIEIRNILCNRDWLRELILIDLSYYYSSEDLYFCSILSSLVKSLYAFN